MDLCYFTSLSNTTTFAYDQKNNEKETLLRYFHAHFSTEQDDFMWRWTIWTEHPGTTSDICFTDY